MDQTNSIGQGTSVVSPTTVDQGIALALSLAESAPGVQSAPLVESAPLVQAVPLPQAVALPQPPLHALVVSVSYLIQYFSILVVHSLFLQCPIYRYVLLGSCQVS